MPSPSKTVRRSTLFPTIQGDELLELTGVQIGRHPKLHTPIAPMDDVVSLLDGRYRGVRGAVLCRPREDIDDVLASHIHHGGDGPSADVVQPATREWKASPVDAVQRRGRDNKSLEPTS